MRLVAALWHGQLTDIPLSRMPGWFPGHECGLDVTSGSPSRWTQGEMMATVDMKANVLAKFLEEYRYDDEMSDFIAVNDLGLPLAVVLMNGLATATADGLQVLEQTWLAFCEMYGVDPEGDYWDMADVLAEDDEELG